MSTEADPPLPDDVQSLRDMCLALLQKQRQFAGLQAQIEETRTQLDESRIQHETTVELLSKTISLHEQTIAQLERQVAELLRRTYGPKREKIDPNQLLLFDEKDLEAIAEELDKPEQTETSDAKSSRRGHGRRPIPANLPREIRRHELTPEQRVCPCCGEACTEMGVETSEQLEFVPAMYKVIEHQRVKYACQRCHDHVTIAAKPPQPVEKGLPGPGLLAHTVLAKYGDHTPLYRQEDQAARHGVILRRSTLCGWVAAAADLAQPLSHRMADLVRESRILWTDDTSVKMIDPLFDAAQTARFWAYIGDEAHPYSVFDFTDSRRRDGPQRFLRGFRGYLQADAYGGYDGIYLESKGAIVEVACWAHARRYWHEAQSTDPTRAHEALGYITRLYQIERECENASAADRLAARKKHARPILAAMKSWLDEHSRRALPKSPIGQAFTYTLNQWEPLNRYTEDGDVTIDNNKSERTVKLCALGRKAWLFVGSRLGGERAAVLFTLIASAKANQVEPYAWLRDVFTRLPSIDPADTESLDELLPDRWLKAHPNHRWHIDQIRSAERRRSQSHRRQKRKRKKK